MKYLIPVPEYPLYSCDIINGFVYNTNTGKKLNGSPTKTKSGKESYLTCSLYNDGKFKNTTIHCVIMAAYLKTWNFDGKEVDHKDRIRRNNRISNLRLVTRKEQMTPDVCKDISIIRKKMGDIRTQAHKDKMRNMAIGIKNNKSKLKESDIVLIRNMYEGKYGEYSLISKLFNVSPSTIRRIILKKNWTHIS